jgi:hypothetical protein
LRELRIIDQRLKKAPTPPTLIKPLKNLILLTLRKRQTSIACIKQRLLHTHKFPTNLHRVHRQLELLLIGEWVVPDLLALVPESGVRRAEGYVRDIGFFEVHGNCEALFCDYAVEFQLLDEGGGASHIGGFGCQAENTADILEV